MIAFVVVEVSRSPARRLLPRRRRSRGRRARLGERWLAVHNDALMTVLFLFWCEPIAKGIRR
jgi:hypothetical protein